MEHHWSMYLVVAVLAVLVVLAAVLLLSRRPALRLAPDVPVVLFVLAVLTAVLTVLFFPLSLSPSASLPLSIVLVILAVLALLLFPAVLVVLPALLSQLLLLSTSHSSSALLSQCSRVDSPRLDGAAGYSVVWKNGQSSWGIKTHTGYSQEAYGAVCVVLARVLEIAWSRYFVKVGSEWEGIKSWSLGPLGLKLRS